MVPAGVRAPVAIRTASPSASEIPDCLPAVHDPMSSRQRGPWPPTANPSMAAVSAAGSAAMAVSGSAKVAPSASDSAA